MSQNRKYTVFISSTYEDLKEVRQKLVWTCLEGGNIPLGMETFPASSDGAWDVIKRAIESADYYAVIVANKYGSLVEGGDGISYTEREFDYAAELKIPILGFVLDRHAPWKSSDAETDNVKRERLDRFREKVQKRTVKFWKNADELHGLFALSMQSAMNTHPRQGWIPAGEAASPKVAEEIARLSAENVRLRLQVAALGTDAAETAKQDKVLAALAKIPSTSGGDGTTLIDFFLKIGYLCQSSTAIFQMVHRFPQGPEAQILDDFESLKAYEVIARLSPTGTMTSMVVYQTTEFGNGILNRWARELLEAKHLTNAAGSAAKPS